MNHIHEFALLFAIAVPFLAIVGLNLFLFFSGERGALLLPSERTLPAVEMSEANAAVIADSVVSTVALAANDAIERKAA